MNSVEFVEALNQRKFQVPIGHIVLTKEQLEGHLEAISLESIKEVLNGFVVTPKLEEWEENVGETFSKIHDEINRKLKFHGIYESDTTIIIDKKQDKFVVVPKQKLQTILDNFKKLQSWDFKHIEGFLLQFGLTIKEFEELLSSKEEEKKTK